MNPEEINKFLTDAVNKNPKFMRLSFMLYLYDGNVIELQIKQRGKT